MSEREKEELRQKLQEMRELVRQEGRGARDKSLDSSALAGWRADRRLARTGGQQEGGGQANSRVFAGARAKEGGARAAGTRRLAGLRSRGRKPGCSGRTRKMLMLSKGQGSSGQGEQSGGGGQGEAGRRWGEGHDPKLEGKATHSKMGTQDTQGREPIRDRAGSRSQVILGAAERGFASRGYKRVYTEYPPGRGGVAGQGRNPRRLSLLREEVISSSFATARGPGEGVRTLETRERADTDKKGVRTLEQRERATQRRR